MRSDERTTSAMGWPTAASNQSMTMGPVTTHQHVAGVQITMKHRCTPRQPGEDLDRVVTLCFGELVSRPELVVHPLDERGYAQRKARSKDALVHLGELTPTSDCRARVFDQAFHIDWP